MRKFLMIAAAAAALTLSACTERSESYAVGASEAWSKVTGAGYAAASFGVPSGLRGADVNATFESAADRTGYWKFTRQGRELGRLNVAVEGDETSSTVSYSYAKGNVGDEDKKAEQMVRQYSQLLVVEAIDSSIEGRARDEEMKRMADAQSSAAMIGSMMKEVDKSMNEAVKRFDAQDRQREVSAINSQARAARTNSTRPTTDLSQYR
jgi:hypothetical protein